MALSVHSFGDNLFRALYSNSLLAVLGLDADDIRQAEASSSAAPDASLLLHELLQGFSFSLPDVKRVFSLADGFQNFTGEGNQQLTQQEIRFYLDYIQQGHSVALPDKNELLILLILNHYFDQLADVSIITEFGFYRAISLRQLEHLAAVDGNPVDVTLKDIARYLAQKAELAQSVFHADMLAQAPDMTHHAGERQQPPAMKDKPFTAPGKYRPAVEMIHSPEGVQIGQKLNLEEADDLALRMQVFSFSVIEILLLIHAKRGPIRLPELEKSLKIVEAYLLDLERLMQTLAHRAAPADGVRFSRALLAKQLETARRSAHILRVLRQYFHEIAEIDGDEDSISKADIENLAGMDGEIEHLTPDDFRNLRKQKH